MSADLDALDRGVIKAGVGFARSGAGNGGVATVTPSRPHRPSRCRDAGCQRALCVAYKEGREDGYEDGYEDGFDEGYRRSYGARQAAAQKG